MIEKGPSSTAGDLLGLLVTELGLSVRSENVLRKIGIKNIGVLALVDEAVMLSWRNFGKKSLRELKEKLESLGLSLGMSADELEQLSHGGLTGDLAAQVSQSRWEKIQADWPNRSQEIRDNVDLASLAKMVAFDFPDNFSRVLACDIVALEYSALVTFLKASGGEVRLLRMFESVLLRKSPADILNRWRVPLDYPVSITWFSARVIIFCEKRNITTIGKLISYCLEYGDRGLLSQRNLGRRSVGEINAFLTAIKKCDTEATRLWIPLARECSGLSLSSAVSRQVASLNPKNRRMMHRRFVIGMTLEESAESEKLTRERTRQIERDSLIGPLKQLMDWFVIDQQILMQKWIHGEPLSSALGPFQNRDDETLAIGAIISIFEEHPQGVAAKLERDLMLNSLLKKLLNSWGFQHTGVDLQGFLDREIPGNLHTAFSELLFNRPGIAIDHGSGRVTPERGSLRRLVTGILAAEDVPMPVSRLLALLHGSPFHGDVTKEKLLRNYRGWLERHQDLPQDKIIWDE